MFGSVLRTHLEDFKQNNELFLSWYKTFECFSFQELVINKKQKQGQEYAGTWGSVWLHLGESLGVHQLLLSPLRCAYPRCAAPDTVTSWNCMGCHEKHYCSQRCQQRCVPNLPLDLDQLTRT